MTEDWDKKLKLNYNLICMFIDKYKGDDPAPLFAAGMVKRMIFGMVEVNNKFVSKNVYVKPVVIEQTWKTIKEYMDKNTLMDHIFKTIPEAFEYDGAKA